MTKDLRKYTNQTSFRLILGGVLLLFIIGDGLIFLIYGPASAATGLICIGFGFIPIGLILVVMWFLDWIVKHANKD
jgi:hypothetical protein